MKIKNILISERTFCELSFPSHRENWNQNRQKIFEQIHSLVMQFFQISKQKYKKKSKTFWLQNEYRPTQIKNNHVWKVNVHPQEFQLNQNIYSIKIKVKKYLGWFTKLRLKARGELRLKSRNSCQVEAIRVGANIADG